MDSRIIMVRKPEVAELAGDKVMIDFVTGNYYILKGTANDIWDMLEDGISVGQVVSKLLQEYEVDEDVCRAAVEKFLGELTEKGFIQLQN